MKKKVLFALLLIFLCMEGLKAQEALVPAGGDASGSGGSISYSVGQVVYTTNTGANGSGVQGVQHAYEISVVPGLKSTNTLNIVKISKTDSSSTVAAGIEDTEFINLKCNVYPNPTSDILTLTIEHFDSENRNLSYRLFDINGKLLERKKLENSNTSISMGNLIPAIYILNVLQGNKSIKTFKIIKN